MQKPTSTTFQGSQYVRFNILQGNNDVHGQYRVNVTGQDPAGNEINLNIRANLLKFDAKSGTLTNQYIWGKSDENFMGSLVNSLQKDSAVIQYRVVDPNPTRPKDFANKDFLFYTSETARDDSTYSDSSNSFNAFSDYTIYLLGKVQNYTVSYSSTCQVITTLNTATPVPDPIDTSQLNASTKQYRVQLLTGTTNLLTNSNGNGGVNLPVEALPKIGSARIGNTDALGDLDMVSDGADKIVTPIYESLMYRSMSDIASNWGTGTQNLRQYFESTATDGTTALPASIAAAGNIKQLDGVAAGANGSVTQSITIDVSADGELENLVTFKLKGALPAREYQFVGYYVESIKQNDDAGNPGADVNDSARTALVNKQFARTIVGNMVLVPVYKIRTYDIIHKLPKGYANDAHTMTNDTDPKSDDGSREKSTVKLNYGTTLRTSDTYTGFTFMSWHANNHQDKYSKPNEQPSDLQYTAVNEALVGKQETTGDSNLGTRTGGVADNRIYAYYLENITIKYHGNGGYQNNNNNSNPSDETIQQISDLTTVNAQTTYQHVYNLYAAAQASAASNQWRITEGLSGAGATNTVTNANLQTALADNTGAFGSTEFTVYANWQPGNYRQTTDGFGDRSATASNHVTYGFTENIDFIFLVIRDLDMILLHYIGMKKIIPDRQMMKQMLENGFQVHNGWV